MRHRYAKEYFERVMKKGNRRRRGRSRLESLPQIRKNLNLMVKLFFSNQVIKNIFISDVK